MALIIGLTGSIASGKSTVSAMVKELHIPVVDADKLARDVVEPGEDAYGDVVHAFGEEILLADRTIDRKKLGEIIFSHVEKREQLNSIVHPAIRKAMLQERDEYVEKGANCVVLDIPLLFESKLTHFVDKTIVVYVEESVQLERLMRRDASSEVEANQRIMSQLSMKKKASLADGIIDNNGSIAETHEQLSQLLLEWKAI